MFLLKWLIIKETEEQALMMGSTPQAANGITLEEEASPPSSASRANNLQHKKKLEETKKMYEVRRSQFRSEGPD